ncbi:MAG: hypothetical protein MUQ56_11025 [Thermoleophilia bacterium]|nr:hypothetical protein [Thermoleophilia bacterium]
MRDITATEAAMDSVMLSMDWPPRPSQAQVTCPCKPATECVLLFKEVGWGTDQDPADRATPEELAQCPLHHPPGDLMLRMVAPKGDIGKWWRKVKRQPARGLVLWHGAEGKVWCAGEASGNTVPQMMRQARRILHGERHRQGLGEGRGEVVLLTAEALDRIGLV